MISRYNYQPIADVWSERSKYHYWLAVELAFFSVFTDIPVHVPDLFYQEWVDAIEKKEKVLRHDLAAFVEWLEEYIRPHVGNQSRFVHYGLTSSDIVDTAFSLQIRETNSILIRQVEEISKLLSDLGTQYSSYEMLGRTHGQAAERLHVGEKFFAWGTALEYNTPENSLYYGRLCGSVGDQKYFDSSVEEKALDELGLFPSFINDGQIIHRSVFARYMNQWALLASTVEKIATDIRLLAQTEIAEMQEAFAKDQVGSSSMPQKRNPILCENICGLARVIRGYQATAMQDIALWNERDISHSSAERIIYPDAAVTLGFMLNRLHNILLSLNIDTDRMETNIEIHGKGIDSQDKMLYLIRDGMSRKEAHEEMRNRTHAKEE